MYTLSYACCLLQFVKSLKSVWKYYPLLRHYFTVGYKAENRHKKIKCKRLNRTPCT